jgi:NADPH:quinone reductase-like Zn-dependent oxidoreductase
VLQQDHVSLAQVSLISQVAGTAYRLIQDFGGPSLLQQPDKDQNNKSDIVVIQNAGTSAVSMCVAELLRIKYPHVHLLSTVRRPDDDEHWPALVNMLTRNGTNTHRHTVVSETTALAAAENRDAWRQWKIDHLPSSSSSDGKSKAKVVLGLNSVHGPQTSRLFFPLLADNAKLVTYGAMSKQSLPVPAAPLIFRNISVCGYWHSRWMVQNRTTTARQEMLDDLCQAVVEGDMQLPDTKFVPLSQARDQTVLEQLLHPDNNHQPKQQLIRPKLVWNLQE